HQHREDIAVDDERRRDQHRREERQRHRIAAREPQKRRVPHARLPISPCGRTSSTRMRRPKEMALLKEGSTRKPESASETPTSNPPKSAPGMLPSPPRMTMMKASSV